MFYGRDSSLQERARQSPQSRSTANSYHCLKVGSYEPQPSASKPVAFRDSLLRPIKSCRAVPKFVKAS